VTDRVRRWYRIGAAATAVVAMAALVLGASGQLFAPGVAPSTTKAVLAQETGAQSPGPQAGARGAADDAPCRSARERRTSRPTRTRSWAPCRSARPKPGTAAVAHRGSGYPTAAGTPPPGTGHARPVSG
jgi:hypothetical protein